MPPDQGAGTVSVWWPTFMIKSRAVEGVVEYVSYMKELADAYATELIWTLALVLGCTCLYIYRALGLQQASRKHSYLVNTRPVFSPFPSPSSSSIPSAFLSAYKSRFAQRDKCKEEDRINAIGCDVLHACDKYNHSPGPRRSMVPRSVWRRHNCPPGQDPVGQPPLSGTGGGMGKQRPWDTDALSLKPWGCASANMPVLASAACGSSSCHQDRRRNAVSAQRTNRPRSTEYRDTPTFQPNSLNLPPYKQQQQQQVQQQIHKLNSSASRSRERADAQSGDRASHGHNVGHAGNVPPLPMPRRGKHPDKITRGASVSSHQQKEVNQGVKTRTEKQYPNARDEHHDDHRNKTKNATPTMQPEDRGCGVKYRDTNKRSRGRSTLPPHATAEQRQNASQLEAQSKNTKGSETSVSDSSGRDTEMAELLQDTLLDQDSSLSRFRSASAALEKFAQVFFTEHRQKSVSSSAAESSSTSVSSQPSQHNSETRVGRKRSKTKQKMDDKDQLKVSKDAKTNLKEDDEGRLKLSKDSKTNVKDQAKPYDSAVLRAIKAEESSKRSGKIIEDTLHFAETLSGKISPDLQMNKPNKAYRYDQRTVHEAGRRLASLRKRLEDSIQLIQNQPGLDKELLAKACSKTKLRKRVEELETMLMKEDILELDSLGTERDQNDCDRSAQPEQASVLSAQTHVADKSSEEQASSKPLCFTQEIHDGEPTGSTGNTQPVTPPSEVNHSKDVQEMQVSKNVTEHSDGKPQPTNNNGMAREKTTHEHDESFGGDGGTLHPRVHTAETSKAPNSVAADKPSKLHAEPQPTAESNKELKSVGSEKLVDDERLDIILERQSKRREDLRQRQRIHIESMLAGKNDLKEAQAVNNSQETSSVPENEYPKSDNIIMDGTPFLLDSKLIKSDKGESSQETGQPGEKQSPQTDMSAFTPYVSTRNLSHLKYEEPEVQMTKADPLKSSNFCLRRRVRWRRQVERSEKQQVEAETQRTPPPVPPKVTRLSDSADGTARPHHLHEDGMPEGSDQDRRENVDGVRTASLQHWNRDVHRPLPSTKLVRGSFIRSIHDKHAVLAAGETGLVAKRPPDNMEICEEKSLTPSLAASVFDPQTQLEKEREKIEAHRASKAKVVEGMPSHQFKANISLFEQAIETESNKCVVDSKVKANVKMFEEASKAQRSVSLSPGRQSNPGLRKRRSPSFPSPRVC